MMIRFPLVAVLVVLAISTVTERMAIASEITLDTVREVLIRQEDTIVFGLIERAKFPFNSNTYDHNYAKIQGFCGSLVDFLVKNTEELQAKAGRFKNPEENPFFPENLLPSLVPSYPFTQILHPGAASININKSIWKIYFHELLPLFVASGDDGNYAQTAASDLSLLQAISKRIHYGKFVAEVKFRESPQDYEPLIRAKNMKNTNRQSLFGMPTSSFVVAPASSFVAAPASSAAATASAAPPTLRHAEQVNNKASQFLKKGCDHYKLLGMLFNKNSATGVLHHSSTQDPPDTDEENELERQYINTESGSHVHHVDDSSDDDIQEVEGLAPSRKRKSQAKAHKRESTSRQMGEALSAWAKASTAKAERYNGVGGSHSLTKCVDVLSEIQDISEDTYMKALDKFVDPS